MSEHRQDLRMGNLSGDFWQMQEDIGMQEHRDIYPDFESHVAARGHWARYVNRLAIDMYDDHFRTQPEPVGVIPTGYAWAGAPFSGVPGSLSDYAFHSSFMRVAGTNVANEYFMFDSPIGDKNKEFVARIRVQDVGRFQLRFDDGTQNNYAAIGLWGSLPDVCHSQVTFSLRTGGGVPVNTNLGSLPISEYYVFKLKRYDFMGGKTSAFIVAEEGEYSDLIVGQITVWGLSRVGFWLTNSASAWDGLGYCDWFYSYFMY